MNHATVPNVTAMLPSVLPGGLLDRPMPAPGGLSRGIRYVADDHGLGQDVSAVCLIHPHLLVESDFLALAS